MGRMMPIDCPDCGKVLDWGDFEPVRDLGCTCPKKTLPEYAPITPFDRMAMRVGNLIRRAGGR